MLYAQAAEFGFCGLGFLLAKDRVSALRNAMAAPVARAGSVAGYVYQMDDDANVLYLAVMFESKAAYQANAERPETNAQFEKMMQFLAAEPEWHDGEVMKVE